MNDITLRRTNAFATKFMRHHCSHLLEEDTSDETLETIADAIVHKIGEGETLISELRATTPTDQDFEGEDHYFRLQHIGDKLKGHRFIVITTNRDGVPIVAYLSVKGF